jgi:hypothetical protein
MAERLYLRVIIRSVGKLYTPTIHGRHVRRLFRTASQAEAWARKLQARYARLKAAAA